MVGYVLLVAFSQYVFELNHDWRPDQTMVPMARLAFIVFALSSLLLFWLSTLWWLPSIALAASFIVAPLVSGAGYTTGLVVYAAILTSIAVALGWMARPKRNVR